jgi:tetratricopeptide (TPR) repeat protein
MLRNRATNAWLIGGLVLAISWIGLGSAAQAEMTVEKLVGTAITGVGPYYQDIADAIRQFGAKNYAKALEHLEAAKKSTPRLAPPEIMMAVLHLDAEQPGPAIAFLERAILRVPQDPEAFLILAERAAAEGRFTEADLMFERAAKNVDSYTDNPRRKQDLQVRALSGAAGADEARGMSKEAKPILESLIKLDPRNAGAYERLGRVLFALGDQKAAYASFQTAAEIDKKLPPAELAMAYLFSDRPTVEKWLNFALNKGRQDLRTQIGAANYMLKHNQLDTAKIHAEEAVKLDPDGFDSNATAGLVARAMSDYPKARTYLEKAHLLSPTHSGVINNLALVLVEMPNDARERALEFAELGVKQSGNSREAMGTLGWIYYRLNRRREAERFLTAAMTLPDGSPSKTMTSEMAYYLAHLAKEQGNIPEAIAMLTDALNTELPFAYRKPAEEFLAKLSKQNKSSPDSKADKTSEAKPPAKADAAR